MTARRGPVGRIFAELQRRHVFRTLALYIVGAWGLMQVADVLLPALALPESSIRYLLFAAIAGLPVALVFGWFFDITAGGIHRTAAAGAAELDEFQPLQGMDYALLGALLLVLGLIGYGLSDAVLERRGETPEQAYPENPLDPDRPPMVGVLPFANLGANEDGDFFATGVHDDLLTSLAKLDALRVVSRTSVLGYAGTTKKIPEIGRELRADAILEGGVRVAGEQIRINAQLIDARSDEHLWAETYDRRLTAGNIFEVQSEIARAIAAALQTTLTLTDSATLAFIPTSNMAAYRAFHETMQWSETVSVSHVPENRQRFAAGMRRAFELDPTFTRPMLELLMRLALGLYGDHGSWGEGALAEVESLIERIGDVAPDSADFYAAQSVYLYYVMRDFDRADALLDEARKKAPSDTRLVEIQSWVKRRQGDFEGWLLAARDARNLDPRSERLNSSYIGRLTWMHRYDEAMREIESLDTLDDAGAIILSVLKLATHHDPARYAAELLQVLEPLDELRRPQWLFMLWEARLAARDMDGAARIVERVVSLVRSAGRDNDGSPAALMPNDLAVQLGQALVSGNRVRTAELVTEIRAAMGLEGLTTATYPASLHPLDRIQLALAEGAKDVVVERASAYWQDPSVDRAEWLGRSLVCQMLGLVGAADESVACLRNLFEEPSSAHPFLEPLLPMYDPIRESAPFRALVSELVRDGWLSAPG